MASRASSLTRGFIDELDGLRGIAILMVMVHRFWPRTGIGVAADVAGAGWIGVDLFFVISGFLIAGILLDTRDEPGYFRNFYARRALRIFPLYYVFVIGVFAAFWSNPGFRDGAGSPLWYLVHLGNVPEGLLDKPVPYWLAPVWSLAIEEQFYLTFPWLVRLVDRRRLTIVLVAMIGAAPVIRLVTMLAAPDHERVQYLFTLCRIDTIAIGCLLAVIVRSIDVERWRERAKLAAFVALPSVAVLAIASRLDRTSAFDRVFGYSIVAVGCASIVALVVLSRGSRVTAPLRFRPLMYLGKLCFGLYLLHRPADTLVSAAAARLGIERELWLLPAKLVVAVALATLSWHLLERPFLALKRRFATAQHPSADAAPAPRASWLLRVLGVSLVVAACGGTDPGARPDGGPDRDAAGQGDAPGDAAVASGRVLYLDGARHSPITPALADRWRAIATGEPAVFAKVGDSITASAEFLACFDGGVVDLGGHTDVAPTLAYFLAGDAGGDSPFARTSLAAVGGTTARDALAGNPSPFAQELTAIAPQLAIVMFGTNELRYGWTVDDAAIALWTLVDDSLARGVVPVMSTIPPNTGDASADARIPAFNRAVRAIAQGRQVPLVDLHRALEPLPQRGISSDGIHPSVSPTGGCNLTAGGLAYGYDVRNLLTLEALTRVRAALSGDAPDASAPARTGSGRTDDPFRGAMPLVDLADTRGGEEAIDHGCGATTGHAVVYRVVLAASRTLDVTVIAPPGRHADVQIIAGGRCEASGDARASATVSGTVDIVVEAQSPSDDGELLLVIDAR
ncbi:MAG TPA: acyltransferase family protein [Kofleriaceae bacterium]|nr:acyltransferase family protein [Kofleriaceae bacterium]